MFEIKTKSGNEGIKVCEKYLNGIKYLKKEYQWTVLHIEAEWPVDACWGIYL